MSVVRPSRVRNKYAVANHRRPVSMPLFLHNSPHLTPSNPPPNLLTNFPSPNTQKQFPDSRITSPLTLGLLSILVVNALYSSYFDITRACIAVFSSLFFLPLVRPARWLTRSALKVSLWSAICTLALISQGWRFIYRPIIFMAQTIRHSCRRSPALNRKTVLSQVFVGVVGLYILAYSEAPLLRLVSIGYQLAQFTLRLLRALVLLQYYMLLLASLEFMIYLRVDCVVAFFGAPWFRWVVFRVWSMLTWTDIVLAMSPSAYYYVHLSLHGK